MRDSYIFYTDRLEKEYRNVFGQIEMYVSSRYVDEETREERLGELLDIFLTAQQSGKSPESVTGHDLEKFCENFCGDFGGRNTFLYMADWLCVMTCFFLIESLIDIVLFFADSEIYFYPAVFLMPITKNLAGCIIGLMFSIIVAVISNAIIRQSMFRKKRVSVKWLQFFSCAAAFFSFIVVFVLVSKEWTVGISCPQIVIFIASGIYLLCYYRFRKRKKTEKIRFSDLLVIEYEKTMPEEMEKKFQKENRKRRKHGKNEITFDGFVEEEEKSWQLEDKISNWIDILIPLVCYIVFFVETYLNGGFDGIFDMIIFIVIMLALGSAIIFGMRRMSRISLTARKNWLLAYRESKNAEDKE
ncbi:MAG: DUF1048 domain-containing protein [Roseburia sp.]|nr:DUF1048 domain-containing protein [Roseburia sp.]